MGPENTTEYARSTAGSAEHDVKCAGKSGWPDLGGGTEGDDQARTGSGIANTHQSGVGLVAGFTAHVHLSDEPLDAATRNGEMDVRGSARIRHRSDREKLIATGCVCCRRAIPLEILITRLIG